MTTVIADIILDLEIDYSEPEYERSMKHALMQFLLDEDEENVMPPR